jgi:hypothetical protein
MEKISKRLNGSSTNSVKVFILASPEGMVPLLLNSMELKVPKISKSEMTAKKDFISDSQMNFKTLSSSRESQPDIPTTLTSLKK